MGKDIRICAVTAKEKEKIQSKARKCGLSTTEYVKQRALGYEPKGIPPDALFVCLEKLDELADKASSPELDEGILYGAEANHSSIPAAGKGVMRYGGNWFLACVQKSEGPRWITPTIQIKPPPRSIWTRICTPPCAMQKTTTRPTVRYSSAASTARRRTPMPR